MPNQASKYHVGFYPVCVGGALLGAVSSQSLLDFFSILLLGGMLFDYFFKRNVSINWIGIEWAILAYFAIISFGLWIRNVPAEDVEFQIVRLTWLPTLFVYIYGVSKLNLKFKTMLFYFSLAFLLPNFYSILTYLFQFDYFTNVPITRAIGLVNSATYHAHANAILFVVFSAMLFFGYSKINNRQRIFFIMALSIFFVSILVTMVRGIWFSIFFSTLLMAAVLNWKLALKFTGAACVVFGLIFAASPQFRARLNPENSTASSDERKNLLKLNWQMFQEYPVLGIGYGENLRRNREYWDKPEWNMPKDYITSHAHNEYVNVLATTGVLGFVFFMCFISFFVRKNWLLLKAQTEKKSLRYALIFACMWAQIEFLMACLTDVTFEYAKIRALYLFVWALLICLERESLTLNEEAV